MAEKKTGIELITEEREKQIKRWGSDHDDAHDKGELLIPVGNIVGHALGYPGAPDAWGIVKKHQDSNIKLLTIAGALIAAEIDRLQRAE